MTESRKPSVALKAILVAAFVAFLGLLVWLAVTLVGALPGAFASLASLAEGLQQARPATEIVVANSNSIINDGDEFTIRWTDLNRTGQYTINVACVPGVSVDMRFPANNITAIPCDETIKLGSNVTELELMINSERQRFIDIEYTIGFIGSDDTAITSTENVVTVVNVSIPQSQSDEVIADDTTSEGEVAGDSASTESESADTPTTPTTPVAGTPTVIATEIFALPTSDPNGFVDLAVTYQGVGRLTDDNHFIPGGVIDSDTRGAFQFEVRNLGTKTSRDWTFEATLTSGATYESETQDGLKPNEYTLITLGFDNVGEVGAQRFGAEITVPGDRNSNNNSFNWAVNVVD